MNRALTLLLAIAIDRAAGDPPTRLHPVGALGALARGLEALAPRGADARRAYGLAAALALPSSAALGVSLLPRLLGIRRGPARAVADAGLLSLGFARRTLLERVREVEDALRLGDVEEARALLARHLVSREVSGLGPDEIAAAAIESLAENLSDSVVAPWLWYALGGLPAAWAYRAANTLDALWGYRDEPYRELGEAAARADDVLNLAPARLTALAICAAAGRRGAGANALRQWRVDGGRTESPNAGHPMAAMAGALGVRLGKTGVYVLGEGLREPSCEDVTHARRIASDAALLAAGALIAVLAAAGAVR